jgi:hypothetical protein
VSFSKGTLSTVVAGVSSGVAAGEVEAADGCDGAAGSFAAAVATGRGAVEGPAAVCVAAAGVVADGALPHPRAASSFSHKIQPCRAITGM